MVWSELPDKLEYSYAFNTFGGVQLSRPLWVGENPGVPGTFLVCEQYSGKVWLLEEVNNAWKKTEFYTADVKAYRHEEEGLLGFAFHPRFKENRKYYLYYTAPANIEGWHCWTILEQRSAAADFRKDSGGNHKILMRYKQSREAHNGASLEFGPDGYLYIGMGDGGNKEYSSKPSEALNTSNALGSILRIDVDREENGKPYAVPADNPWVDNPDFMPETFAYGFRNIWRMSFDPLTGDLWVGDVGNVLREEIDIVRKGENHGWRIMEGNLCFNRNNITSPLRNCDKTGLTMPLIDFDRNTSKSITGGYVFRAAKASPFYGAYICADYGLRRFYVMKQKNGEITEYKEYPLRAPFHFISSFGTDTRGNLYMTGWSSSAYTKEDKMGVIFKLDLGEPDPFTAVTDKEGQELKFRGLKMFKQVDNSLGFRVEWDGEHQFELRDLRGSLTGHQSRTGAGMVSISLPKDVKGIHVLVWKYNGLTFSKRLYVSNSR